jgi:hypothetical protein
MNTTLLNILKRIVADHGENILADPQRLKPLFSDYAKNEQKEERVAFGRCIEAGAYYELKKAGTADERKRIKTTLINKVHAQTGIDWAQCNDALNLLEAVMFKQTQQTHQLSSSFQTSQTQTNMPYNAQSGNFQSSKKSSAAKNFVIFILVAALIYGIGYYVITNSNTNFNLAVWRGYSSYAEFSRAIDLDELFGKPLNESGFRAIMALAFFGQFLSQNELSIDIVSGTKLTERYGVSGSLRENYNYLTKFSPFKNAKNYIAYFNGDSWIVLIWKNDE